MRYTITLILLTFLCIISNINAQTKDVNTFKDDVEKLYKDKSYDPDKLIHYKALNIIFNQEINKLLTEASDLSTRAAYATLEEEDNRLTLGYSINPDNTTTGNTDYVRTIWSMGIQADIEDNFSALSRDSELQNNIGVFLKYTRLFKGNIWYQDKSKVQNFRDKYLLDKALEYKYQEYQKSKEERSLAIQKKMSFDNTIDEDTEEQNTYKQAVNTAYHEILTEEAKTIKEGKFINGYRKAWTSFRVYMPISITEYEVYKEESSTKSETKKYYPLTWEGSLSGYFKSRTKGTLQLTGFYKGFFNNSIEANILKSRTFTSIPDNTATPVELSTQNKFIGDYESFVTHNLKGDLVYFFPNQFFGVSASFDYSLGDYEALTWKIGIPFYFKGKNDDSAVSVELEWREIHEKTLTGTSTHALGFSIGIPFGNYIN